MGKCRCIWFNSQHGQLFNLWLWTIAKAQAEHKVYCRRDRPGMALNPTRLWFTMRRRCLLSLKEILMSQTLVSETFDFDWFVFVSTLYCWFWKIKDCHIFSDWLVDGAQDGGQHWGSDWRDACRGEFVTNKQVSDDVQIKEMVDWWLHPYSHVWIVKIPRHWIWNACNRTW